MAMHQELRPTLSGGTVNGNTPGPARLLGSSNVCVMRMQRRPRPAEKPGAEQSPIEASTATRQRGASLAHPGEHHACTPARYREVHAAQPASSTFARPPPGLPAGSIYCCWVDLASSPASWRWRPARSRAVPAAAAAAAASGRHPVALRTAPCHPAHGRRLVAASQLQAARL